MFDVPVLPLTSVLRPLSSVVSCPWSSALLIIILIVILLPGLAYQHFLIPNLPFGRFRHVCFLTARPLGAWPISG
jgi:hypothetical protein